MTHHLNLVCAASTSTQRGYLFPGDESLDDAGRASVAAARGAHADRCLASPARRALETAGGLGFEAAIDPALGELDYGRWRGLSMSSVRQSEPEAFADWLSDPASAPHGGESVLSLIERAAGWLDRQQPARGVTVAVTHAGFIRAAIVAAIEGAPQSFWRIDIAPLTLARLSGTAGRWNLVSLGPLGEARGRR